MKARPFIPEHACSLLILLCACGSGHTFGASTEGQPQRGESGDTAVHADQAFAQVTRELIVMRREMADMQREQPQAPMADVESQSRHDLAAGLKAERVQRKRAASIEAAFRIEKVDPRWSQETAAILRTAFDRGDETLRGQVRTIECRSQSCRVEIVNSAGTSLQRSLPFIAERLAPALPNMTATQADQSLKTLLYFSRSREVA